MTRETCILAFDTSAAYCAAALLYGDRVLVRACEEMSRGQAERLMPLLAEVLEQGGIGWADLSALGVGIGPGNFTGIRIAVSAARGLALALEIPAVGVGGCEARAHLAAAGDRVAIPAPRDQVYLCTGSAMPELVARDAAEQAARHSGTTLRTAFDPADLAEATARIAATRWRTERHPPAPLYARPADAAPSRDIPPVLLD